MVRAERSGHFLFPAVPEGLYLLTARREHYFPASFGQRLPGGHGTPIQVTRDSDFFGELRMRRMGAVTGRILDENGIGLPDIPVVAYRAKLPLRIAGHAVSDDRGVYRIHGLDPGRYWVRTAAQTLDDGSGLLPTFAPESGESRDARLFRVAVDSETPDADIRPVFGSLLRLTVTPQCQPLGAPVAVTLSSETGRRTVNGMCGDARVFEGLAPAVYDIYGESADKSEFGFIEMFVGQNDGTTLIMAPPPRVMIAVRGGASGDSRPRISLRGHRQDLAESSSDREIAIPQTTLAPGYWEFTADAGPNEYVESIETSYPGPRRPWRRERPEDRFEVFVDARRQVAIQVIVSAKAGSIAGTVQAESNAAAGIPVFLWPVAEQARRSLRGQMQTLSDANGAFHFDGLPPGDYRAAATFDLNEADEESMEAAHARVLHVEASQVTNATLAPWAAPE